MNQGGALTDSHHKTMRYREEFDSDDYYAYDSRPRGHWFLGIASFFLALASGFFMLGVFVLGLVLSAREPYGIDDDSPMIAIFGILFIFGISVDVVAITVGGVSLGVEKQNKAFAWLGIGIGATILIGSICLMAVGAILDGMGM
jgi:hypothetical protein